MKIHLLLEEQGTGGGGFQVHVRDVPAGGLEAPQQTRSFRFVQKHDGQRRQVAGDLGFCRPDRKKPGFRGKQLREFSAMIVGRADEEEKLFTELLHFTK